MDSAKEPQTVQGSTTFIPTWEIKLIWDIEEYRTVSTSDELSTRWNVLENTNLAKNLEWKCGLYSGSEGSEGFEKVHVIVFAGDSANLIDHCEYDIIAGNPGSEKCVSTMRKHLALELAPEHVDQMCAFNKRDRIFPCKINIGGDGCPSNLLDMKDTLRLTFNIKIVFKPENRQGYQRFPTKKDSSKEKWIASLFNNDRFADVIIKCEGASFSAHKMILGQSPVFDAMLTTTMREAVSNEIVITDTDPYIFECFLKSMYGVAFALPSKLEEILQLANCAEKYDVLTLKVLCFEKLAGMLSDENAAELTIAAHQFCMEEEMSEFRNYFRQYCMDRHKVLIRNPQYKQLFFKNLEIFT